MNDMSDMRVTIIPKSDQKNADDLLAGPITITVREVSIRPSTEQPVSIHFEGDGGKPYKPCKSMCRVLVAAWGPDAKAYVGRSMTLYCDPKVTWGGMAVGGIRISHLSHINGELMMALTATKGQRKPFVVKPMQGQQQTVPAPKPPASDQKAPDKAPTFSEDVIDGDGQIHTFDNVKDYITGIKLAVSGATDKGAVWSDNAKAFGEIMDRARANNRPKTVAALEAAMAEINAALAA